MKSITIHDLDDSLEVLLEQTAKDHGLSLNRTVKMLLRKALGLEPNGDGERRADFAEFCGGWSKADAAEFERHTKDFRKIDPRDWQ